MSEAFGALSAAMIFVIYGLYWRQVVRGASTPNPSTWCIWMLIGWLNCATYFQVVDSNLSKAALALAAGICMTLLCGYFALKGKFVKPHRLDVGLFLMAVVILVFWLVAQNAVWANILLQLCFIVSYIPTLRGLIAGQAREAPMVWMLGVMTYAFNVVSIAAGEKADLAEYVFPVVNGILGNGSVVLVTLKFRRFQSWF